MSINYIDLLPDEIVFLVFKKLDCVASCRFAQTSKRFYHLIRASLEHTLIRCPLEWGLSVQIRMLNLAVEDEAQKTTNKITVLGLFVQERADQVNLLNERPRIFSPHDINQCQELVRINVEERRRITEAMAGFSVLPF